MHTYLLFVAHLKYTFFIIYKFHYVSLFFFFLKATRRKENVMIF